MELKNILKYQYVIMRNNSIKHYKIQKKERLRDCLFRQFL